MCAYIDTENMPLHMPVPGTREPAQIALLNENCVVLSNHDHTTGKGLAMGRLRSGLDAARPATGSAGNVYFATDTGRFYVDTGTAWVEFITTGGTATITGWTLVDPIIRDTLNFGPEPTGTPDATIARTGAGALRVDSNLGVGGNPAAWATTHRAVQIGLASAVNADVVNATDIELSQNTIIGQAARTAAYTGPAAMLRLAHPASLTFSTAASVAAGAAQTFTTRASIAQNGTLTLTADEGASGLVVNGSVVTTSTNNTAGYQFASRDTAAQGFLWYAQAGNAYLYDLVKPANRLQISPTGTLTLTPDAGQFTLTGGNPADHLRITAAANHVLFSAPGGVVGPATDNTLSSGTAGLRWTAVYAVTGTIQTSSLEMKENVRPLDPVAALAAVKGTEVILFNYKAPPPPDPLPEGYQAPPQFEHAGYDAAAVDPLLVMDDQSVNPQNTASVLLAAMQDIIRRLEVLEASSASPQS